MMSRIRGGSGALAALLIWVSTAPGQAWAEDHFIHRTIAELTITEGRLPRDGEPDRPGPARPRALTGDLGAAMQPYAVIDGPGEVYLGRDLDGRAAPELGRLRDDDVIVFRIPDRREVAGRLFAPRSDGTGMEIVRFKVSPPPSQADARSRFARAKQRHYERLAARGMPGAAWFEYRARHAENTSEPAPANAAGRDADDPGAIRALALFSGGRAIDENLQLDRPLPQRNPSAPSSARPTVKTGSITGITVAEIDWTARIQGKNPALDPLASSIPADQHAVFLPSLKSVDALLAELNGRAMSMIGLALAHSEDGGVQRKYEQQLCVRLADLPGSPEAASIRSLAATGSDPYLPSGTDVAILLETESPGALAAFIQSRIEGSRRGVQKAVDAAGQIEDVSFSAVTTPDRRVSAYLAILGKVVVLTNSRIQLERLVAVSKGKARAMADVPEYRFFRDRYPRGAEDESAFVVLTDATIRRWCGPRWRIGSSRRVRAASALAELQSANLERMSAQGPPASPPAAPNGLGTVDMTATGPRSETYGTLEFQTPIVELSLDDVDQAEADSYAAWRDTYQQNWRGLFDPIAVRLSMGSGRIAADVSVMPLIAASQYRTFVELVGNARIATDAGDRHDATLVHASMALDRNSTLFSQGSEQVAGLMRVPRQVALGWLGSSVALYVDNDPIWKELAGSEDPQQYLNDHLHAIPIGAHLEVIDSVKLALFLSGLRAFVDQSGPNLTTWENHEYKGMRYVKVAEAEGARAGAGRPRFAIYYVTTPRSLTLSLSEGVVRRFIERQAEKRPADPQLKPWLGQSLALQVSSQGLEVLRGAGRKTVVDELRARSWANIPVLNEWKRLFPDRDPVTVHDEAWGVRLVDPSGGRYVWNPQWATMESTVFGHPGAPTPAPQVEDPLARFGSTEAGLSFADGGVRARVEIGFKAKDGPAARSNGRGDGSAK